MTDERPQGEWGFASLILASVVALSIFPALLLMVALWATDFAGLNPKIAGVWGFFVGALVQCVSITAVVFGAFDIKMSLQVGRIGPLGLAGVILGVVDVFAWTIVALQWSVEFAAVTNW